MFKLKLAKLENILKCKSYDESVTKDEVLQVRSEALNLSEELSYFQIRLLEKGMDVYSSVESIILLAEEECGNLLKQCEVLVSKLDQNREKIGCKVLVLRQVQSIRPKETTLKSSRAP